MTPKHWVAAGALALASFAVAAQSPAAARPDPLDAGAAVPPITYKSAFEGQARTSSAAQPSADKAWRQANAELGSADAHSGHAAAPAAPPPATPAPVDHSKHHQAPPPATPATLAPVDHSKHHQG